MGPEKSHSWIRGILKAAGILLGVLLLLLLAARLSLNSDWLRELVRERGVAMANRQLNATLTVESLEGDLWREMRLSGIRLGTPGETEGGKPLAAVDSIRITYDLLSFFSPVFEVGEIRVEGFRAEAVKREEAWNFEGVVRDEGEPASAFGLRVGDLRISNSRLGARGVGGLPDSSFAADGLELRGSVFYLAGEYELNLASLSFRLSAAGIAPDLEVESTARASGDSLTLERLVLGTGRTLLRSSGNYAYGDSSGRLSLDARPLDWRDLSQLWQAGPGSGELQAELTVSGSSERTDIILEAASEEIRNLRIQASFSWTDGVILEGVEASADRLDLAALAGDSTLPVRRLRDVRLGGEGRLAPGAPREGEFKGRFQTGETTLYVSPASPRQEGRLRTVDSLDGDYSYEGPAATGSLAAHARAGRQEMRLRADLQQIWQERPRHHVQIDLQNADLTWWSGDAALQGGGDLAAEMSGWGWMPGNRFWTYDVRSDRFSYRGEPLDRLRLRGGINRDSLYAEGEAGLRENLLRFTAGIGDYTGHPRFRYRVEARDFDLSPFAEVENLSTALTFRSEGRGSGGSLETLALEATVEMDSSIVNGEFIRRFGADLQVRDTVLTIRDATLESDIARGSLSGELHLLRPYDPANRLDSRLELLDLRSLAAVAGASTLRATGSVAGRLRPLPGRDLQFSGEVDLEGINYDSLFTVEGAVGKVDVLIAERSDYMVDLALDEPEIAAVLLQDLRLESRGGLSDGVASGTFRLQFSGSAEGSIEHAGRYRAADDSLSLITDTYNLSSSLRTLSLDRPFALTYHGGAVRMDTMRLAAADGEEAMLELAVPHASSQRQEVWLRGRSLNTSVIQNTLLGESRFGGMLSGELSLTRRDSLLDARGSALLSEFDYRGAGFDTLDVDFRMSEGRFDGSLSLRTDGMELLSGELHAPFRLGDPTAFPDDFFEEEVSGRLETGPLELSRFEELMAGAGLEDTGGLLRFSSRLSGTAGDPDVRARASLVRAMLSGVSVDSVSANLDYSHDTSRLDMKAAVHSLGQRAADIVASCPFYMDFREFALRLPEGSDSVSVAVVTDDFNLAALNDFVDPQQMRQVEGKMNGVMRIGGTVDDPQAEGELNLRRGALRLMEPGIRLDRIGGTLRFEGGQMRLSNFSARSGKGTLTASGTMQMARLEPGEMDVTVSARNFQAASTSGLNALVNLDARARGTPERPSLSGSLSVLNGFIMMDNFGEQAVEQVSLDTLAGPDYTAALYDSLALDMNVSFDRRFYVRNRRYMDMEMEIQGEVDLLKETGREMEAFGSLNSLSGYVSPLGKRFELEEGMLSFAGDPSNPDINVRSLYVPPQAGQDIRIWYIIEGSVEDPRFRYESSPTMELENIISYTLFGQPFYALDSWKQVVAGTGSNTTAADVALDVLLDRVESLATRRLGIDVVKIDNARVGGENGTAVTTGWYLSPRVFFAIQNVITDATPDTHFLLEYLLMKNLKLIISQGNDTRQGIDLKWNYDY